MTDLLTREEYKTLAAKLALPTSAFIDGSYRPAHSGKTFSTVNPATGDTLAEVAACGTEDVEFAVVKAREAFDDGRWSKLHPSERKDILIRFAKLLTRNRRELAVMESLDSG
ncbi:MAG: aldehyde dehydrogenase family protein, partial [Rhodobacteraceae bacterium]|nr:aldehyde dehydrogenase family protein [Paracoccaceae bacterium]